MRRRRKKGSPLLMRILGVSVLLHIIALPILAHYGTFKKIQQNYIVTQIVSLPPPEKEKPEVHKETPKPKAAPKKAASNARAHHAAGHPSAVHSNLNTPHVVAAAGDGANGGGGDGGDVVQGTGVAGQVPTQAATPAPPPATPAPEATATAPATAPAATPEPTPTPTPTPTPAPTPTPTPVYTQAVALDKPQPIIPDSLRMEALDKSVVAEFSVSEEGVPTNVTITESSGDQELDRLAQETAKQWRFKPATRNGQPIASTVRLHIEFRVT